MMAESPFVSESPFVIRISHSSFVVVGSVVHHTQMEVGKTYESATI